MAYLFSISSFSERDPNLFEYLIKQGAHPVRIAFRWLIRAFAGFLPAAEVIYLWDYILAFDSLGKFFAKLFEPKLPFAADYPFWYKMSTITS